MAKKLALSNYIFFEEKQGEIMSINCAIIMGRLTADPELRTTQSGNSVTSFSVAVDRNYQKQGQERETDFINVVAWKKTAEIVCKYFRKGSMIAVQGSIQTRNYEDRNGNKRTAVEIVADTVSFTGSKAESNQGVEQATQQTAKPDPSTSITINAEDDDLPF